MSYVPTSSKRKRRIIVYGLVTRYGPQSEQEVNHLALERRLDENCLPQNCNILSVLSVFKYNSGKTNNQFVTR